MMEQPRKLRGGDRVFFKYNGKVYFGFIQSLYNDEVHVITHGFSYHTTPIKRSDIVARIVHSRI